MWNNFFKHIDIEPQHTHILNGNASNLQAECEAFEQKITAAGGIELFVGGAFNKSDPHKQFFQTRIKRDTPVTQCFVMHILICTHKTGSLNFCDNMLFVSNACMVIAHSAPKSKVCLLATELILKLAVSIIDWICVSFIVILFISD